MLDCFFKFSRDFRIVDFIDQRITQLSQSPLPRTEGPNGDSHDANKIDQSSSPPITSTASDNGTSSFSLIVRATDSAIEDPKTSPISLHRYTSLSSRTLAQGIVKAFKKL